MGYGDATVETPDWVVPDYVPEELVHPLDHWNGREYLVDPVGYWDSMRDTVRAFWSPLLGGFWCLTRYDDMHDAFSRPEDFSSRFVNIPGREVRLVPVSMDAPEHILYRRVLNRPLAPLTMQTLSTRIRALCVDLIDAVVADGSCDFMEAVAKPLPSQIFCGLLGLPLSDVDQFLEWNYVIQHVNMGDEARRQEHQRVIGEVNLFLNDLVNFRKTNPSEDLISLLLASHIGDGPISDQDALDMTFLLFLAGLDTVTAGLAWSWGFLGTHPDHRRQIVNEPDIIPTAMEELLRFHSFVEVSRVLTKDIEFAGVGMKEGDRIMLPTSSAGRDAAQFPNAMTVDFRREPNRHLAFAGGPHRCVGSHLARTELRIALEEWHRRVPDYEVPDPSAIRYHGGAVVGPDNMPIEVLATA